MYEMEALGYLHSQRLFFKRLFGGKDCCPDMLKEVSEKILKKCGGLPLAIISISGLLANIPTVKEEWEKIERSIGSALEKNRSLEGMSNILSLSYNYLPPNLKTCLLYLCAFPEDSIIERRDLVSLWIGEGFIPEERGQSQVDVADRYFYELVNKSMLQPMKFQRNGMVHACRVHDMMLEILISKSIEDNFITIVGSGQASLKNHQGIIRRLSIQNIDQEHASILANEDLTHVRSLIISHSCDIKNMPSLVKFQALRVLYFSFTDGLQKYIMKGLDKLFNLKYLRLRGRGISKLPSGIVMLHDLETLDLLGTSVEELPVGFGKLTKLEHVLTENEIKAPNGIGDMVNLQVISRFNITQSPLDVVEDLGNLRKLNRLNVRLDSGRYSCVEKDSGRYFCFGRDRRGPEEQRRREEMFLSSMCKLGNCKLQDLTINREGGSLEFLDSWSPLPSSLQSFTLSTYSCFTNFPKWITPALTNLSLLNLHLTELNVEGLRTLGELPALRKLYLVLKTGPEDRLTVQAIWFPILNVFNTRGADFVFVEGAMPNLRELHMSSKVSVAQTYGFYSGIEHLPSLELLEVYIPGEGVVVSTDRPAVAANRKEAAHAFMRQAASHPNDPTVKVLDYMEMKKKSKEWMMISGHLNESRRDLTSARLTSARLQQLFSTGGGRNIRFLRNLGNLGNFPGEGVIVSSDRPAVAANRKDAADAFMRQAASHPNDPTVNVSDYMENEEEIKGMEQDVLRFK